jgi:hypothetical protein
MQRCCWPLLVRLREVWRLTSGWIRRPPDEELQPRIQLPEAHGRTFASCESLVFKFSACGGGEKFRGPDGYR